MATRAGIDANRLFLTVMVAVGLIMFIVWLSQRGPSSPPEADRPEPAGPAPVLLPEIAGDYELPDWEVMVGDLSRSQSVPVALLDPETGESGQVHARPAPGGSDSEWITVAVTFSYTGSAASSGLRLNLADARLIPAGAEPSPLVSARRADQAFFPILQGIDFPPLALDADQTRAEMVLLFAAPKGLKPFILRRAETDR